MKRLLVFIICLSLLLIQFPAATVANAANNHVKIEPYNDQFDIMRTDFGWIDDFSEGRAAVGSINDEGGITNMGYINKKGEIVIPTIYSRTPPFSEGIACVGNTVKSSNGKYIFEGKIIDINGKVLHKTNHGPKENNSFHDGILMTDDTTYITTQGKVIFSAQSMSYPAFKEGNCSEGLIPVSVVTGWDYTLGIIDKSGKWVAKGLEKITDKYGEHIRQIGEFHEGLALYVTTGKQWGYIDRKGKVVASGFDGVGDFVNGLAVARKDIYSEENGRTKRSTYYGMIDKTFKWVIEPKYIGISYFEDGVDTVGIDRDLSNIDKNKLDNTVGAQTYGVIDVNGNMIVPFNKYNVIYGFSEGYARYNKGLYTGEVRYGYMDTKGNIVAEFDPSDYDGFAPSLGDFHDGMATITTGEGSRIYTTEYLMKRDSSSPIRVKLDGKFINLPVDPVSENGGTLVPFRTLFEALGVSVEWDGTTKTVTGTKGNIEIKLQQGSKEANVNGQPKTLGVPVKVINGSTFVPVRFVSESLGLNVEWDNSNRIVKLTTIN